MLNHYATCITMHNNKQQQYNMSLYAKAFATNITNTHLPNTHTQTQTQNFLPIFNIGTRKTAKTTNQHVRNYIKLNLCN